MLPMGVYIFNDFAQWIHPHDHALLLLCCSSYQGPQDGKVTPVGMHSSTIVLLYFPVFRGVYSRSFVCSFGLDCDVAWTGCGSVSSSILAVSPRSSYLLLLLVHDGIPPSIDVCIYVSIVIWWQSSLTLFQLFQFILLMGQSSYIIAFHDSEKVPVRALQAYLPHVLFEHDSSFCPVLVEFVHQYIKQAQCYHFRRGLKDFRISRRKEGHKTRKPDFASTTLANQSFQRWTACSPWRSKRTPEQPQHTPLDSGWPKQLSIYP